MIIDGWQCVTKFSLLLLALRDYAIKNPEDTMWIIILHLMKNTRCDRDGVGEYDIKVDLE